MPYQQNPHTLDPTQHIPDDAPGSAGHIDGVPPDAQDEREQVKVQHDEHKQAVADDEERAVNREQAEASERQQDDSEQGPERQSEPGPERQSEQSDEEPQPEPQSDDEPSDDEPPKGSIDEVLTWVGDDHERAQQALDAERAGQNRSTLVTRLEAI